MWPTDHQRAFQRRNAVFPNIGPFADLVSPGRKVRYLHMHLQSVFTHSTHDSSTVAILDGPPSNQQTNESDVARERRAVHTCNIYFALQQRPIPVVYIVPPPCVCRVHILSNCYGVLRTP